MAPGSPGQDADDRDAAAGQVEEHGQHDGADDGHEDARRPWREPLEAQDDGQAQETDAQRPGVRQAVGDTLEEGHRLRHEAAGVGGEAEQLGQLADEDDDREAGQVACAHGVGEQVRDEAELSQARPDGDQPHQEGQHPRQRDSRVRVASREGQDGGRDHGAQGGVRAQDQDWRGAHERVGDEADDGGIEPGDGGQPGQLRVGHPLGHEERHEHDARDQVTREPGTLVRTHGAQAWNPVLDAHPRAGRGHPDPPCGAGVRRLWLEPPSGCRLASSGGESP